jgi:hypothetical protein
MAISRSRNTQHKVYIPSSARKNHYLLVKFPVTDDLLAKHNHLIDKTSERPYQKFYQMLADNLYTISNELDIESAQFIANDKFSRVRYSPEKLTVQTDQQILFLYNPRNHYNQNTYINGKKRVKNISIVFLANGDDVRAESANFHKKVTQSVSKFADVLDINLGDIRVCDHQHLTYDLFANDKGVTGTQTHKLRTIKNRYSADDIVLPTKRDVLTYAVIDLPINRRLKNIVEINKEQPAPYQALYDLIKEAFVASATKQGLLDGAVLANGLTPIVRNSDKETLIEDGELYKLGYNPFEASGKISYVSDGDCLVDAVKLVLVATVDHKTPHGYGKFLNQVELALRSTAEKLNYVNDKEELVVRLHQHIGYNL